MFKIFLKNKGEKGAALLFAVIIILSIIVIISLGQAYLNINSIVTIRNKIKSVQSYYAAESGLEDSLLRLKNNLPFVASYNLPVDNSTVNINISNLVGGTRTITAKANTSNQIKKLSVLYTITTDNVSFFYGAQVGNGGLTMENNSRIEGNVFSNGSVLPGSGGISYITETVTVAGNGNKIEQVEVGGDVYVHSCKDSDITGTLHYVSGGSIQNCSYGALVNLGPNEIMPEDLPIPPEQITEWKDEAATGGTISGNYVLAGGATASLGSKKITGNMLIDNNSTLNLTGLVYVQGDITIKNNATVKLDSSFDSLSGIIVNDGKILVENGAILKGSGISGSFLMLLSTNSSLDLVSPAINVSNNAQAAIFYASNGLIVLNNNINVKEVTAYKLYLNNNAIVSYEIGLENVNFTSGPGGSWEIKDWQEIE